jgi:hypothetical protein
MFIQKIITYTVYAHNLEDHSRSFSKDITVKDFNRNIDWRNFAEAKRIVYVNPKGISITLKDKNGVK